MLWEECGLYITARVSVSGPWTHSGTGCSSLRKRLHFSVPKCSTLRCFCLDGLHVTFSVPVPHLVMPRTLFLLVNLLVPTLCISNLDPHLLVLSFLKKQQSQAARPRTN